ncbi:MAG: hypothetical protein M0R46_08555 [Candidatus Muirbacterium halophilum]|nr:hypothetical protein [Candidatus Muirbacterium halophilum]MCK9475955.1 hypothetical protein [Candidatus Muirbacterium halophilum]
MIKQKYIAFISGIIFILFIIEILLHIFSFSKYRNFNTFSNTENQKVIMCAGDSFTYGMGLKDNETYPSYLKNILISNGNDNIEVINLGILGANSHMVYKKIKRKIKKVKPDIIIFQAGISNRWNFKGFDFEENSFITSFLFDNIKIIKVYLIVKDYIKKKIKTYYIEKNFNFIKKSIVKTDFKTCIIDLDLNNLGFKLLRNSKIDDAKQYFLNKNSVEDVFGLGLTYINMGKEEEAESIFLSIKDKYEGLIGLGYLNLEFGNFKTSFDYLLKAIKLNSNDTSAYLILADLYQKNGYENKAEFIFKSILTKKTDSFHSYLEYYEFLEENENSEKAGEILNLGLKKLKNDERIFIQLASHSIKKGDFLNCEKYLKNAENLNPNNAEIYTAYSYNEILKHESDFFEKAEKFLLKAYSMNPYNKDTIESLAELYFNNDKNEIAEFYYKKLKLEYREKLLNFIKSKKDFSKLSQKNLRKDIENLIDICKLKDIKLFIMNYPYYRMNNIYDIFQDNPNVLIDIDRKFKNLDDLDEISNYLQKDGHFNAKGAELAANTAYEHLKKQGLLK